MRLGKLMSLILKQVEITGGKKESPVDADASTAFVSAWTLSSKNKAASQ